MAKPKEIWVLPEISDKEAEISRLSLGLLSEAKSIAEEVDGTVTAVLLGEGEPDYAGVFRQYGVSNAYIFRDPLFRYYSAEAYAAALVKKIQDDQPWLFLMGHTAIGRELAPRLALPLKTGVIANCVRIDLANPERPLFFRPVYGGQLYQEVIYQTERTMLVTMDTRVLNVTPGPPVEGVKTRIIKPRLSPQAMRVKHLGFLPADFRTADLEDAEVIVSAGMGVAADELLPIAEELASLIQGALGTTRPVVDEEKMPRERMIGQTGKVVNPHLYLALGISGSEHHVRGIQDSGTIVAINRDPKAPIFQNSDVGLIADIRDVLPRLIERIKAKGNDQAL
jgi:electron transfer flavoprotein alpha subunit